jgi:DNA polymerase-3 subunit delta'
MQRRTRKGAGRRFPEGTAVAETGKGPVRPAAPPAGPRWLPFSRIAGQREAIWRLQSAVASGRLHHSLLLDGPRGCGKTTLAVALGTALACRRRPDPLPPLPPPTEGTAGGPVAWPLDGCGECPSCRKMPDHPDLIVVEVLEGKTRIGIDQVREVLARLAFAPHESDRRTVIFRDADRMTEEAANALLKGLEEPPSGTLMVLTTARPAHLLPTIRSRCLRVPLRSLPPGVVRRLVSDRVPDADPAALDLAAGLSAGGVSRAIDLLRAETAQSADGAGRFARAVGREDLGEVLGAAEAAATDREGTTAFLDVLLVLLRDRIAQVHGGTPMLGTAVAPLDAFDRHPPGALPVECARVAEARRDVEANVNPLLALEWLGVSCARAVSRARRGRSADG